MQPKRNVIVKLGANVLYSVEKTREFFDKLAETHEQITMQNRGEASVTVVTVDKTHERFVTVHAERRYYNNVTKIPYTINYIDVMNNDVKLITKEGKSELYEF